MNKDIKIYGKLVNKTTDRIVADSEQIQYNDTNVKEIEVVSLDDESLYETGIYNIKSATELPKDSKISSGKLVVEVISIVYSISVSALSVPLLFATVKLYVYGVSLGTKSSKWTLLVS